VITDEKVKKKIHIIKVQIFNTNKPMFHDIRSHGLVAKGYNEEAASIIILRPLV
jgi:hypothetical protein